MINSDKPGVSVVTLLFNPKKQLLMGERISAHQNGRIAIPGGSVEFGESIAEAAVREPLEETGLKVINPRPLNIISDIYYQSEQKHFITFWYTAEIVPPEPNWDWSVPFIEKDKNGKPKCKGWYWQDYAKALLSDLNFFPDTINAWSNCINNGTLPFTLNRYIIND